MNNLDGSIYNALVAAKLAGASGGGGGNIASNNVTAMTGYEEAETASSIETTDSLNQAVGKLEKGIDDNKTNISNQQDTIADGGNGYAIVNGIRVYVSATAPTGTIPDGSIGVGW